MRPVAFIELAAGAFSLNVGLLANSMKHPSQVQAWMLAVAAQAGWSSVRVPPMKRKVVSQKYRFLRWTRYFGISGGDFQSNSAFERHGGFHTFRLYRFSARS